MASLATAAGHATTPDDPAAAPVGSGDPEQVYAIPTTLDRLGRILAPVEVNGHGPLRFILDTGANRSAVSAATAARLGLVSDAQASVNVHGITGSAVLPTVRLTNFRAGDLLLQDVKVPVLPAAVFGGADGILGIDSLQQARIEVDFRSGRVTIRRSPARRSSEGFLLVPAKVRHGGLLMVNARVGRVQVKAVLDTGAERSLGNEALRRALVARTKLGQDKSPTTVIGATPQLADGESFVAPSVSMGGATLENLLVTFADLHIFKHWGLLDRPALIVGMDLLGTLDQFVVDYPRREFYLRP